MSFLIIKSFLDKSKLWLGTNCNLRWQTHTKQNALISTHWRHCYTEAVIISFRVVCD